MSTDDSKPDWRAIAAAKVAAREALIPPAWRLGALAPGPKVLDVTHVPETCGILSPLEIEITHAPAVTILARVAKGDWKARAVTEAFCKRAAIAHQLVNCLAEICFEEALARAQELDDVFAENGGKVVGPLHGLPISIKDNFRIKGLDSTVGFITWCNDPQDEDSVLITILREAGAVLYCKTNVPTAMMMPETYNNVFGRTLNPYNRNLSPGGSSGGEAALLALRGSPLGVGTDIGGSIRIPGSLGGVYTLRPSFGRFPTYGARSAMAGQEAINSVNGPLSRDLSSLELFAATVVGAEPWKYDPRAAPLTWRQVDLPQKLAFGLIRDDGVVRVNPPVRRALETAADALRAAGHDVIEFDPFEHARGTDLLARCFLADGGTSIKGLIAASGEDWPAGLKAYAEREVHPSTYEMWQIQSERLIWAKGYLDAWMATAARTTTGREIDAIILPTCPFAGVLHDKFEHVGYTGVWNVLDWAAATVPVLRADPALDPREEEYTPRSEMDERVWRQYDPEAYAGGPVSVQVVGRRMEEEKVLAICGVLEAALKGVGVVFGG